MIGETLSSVDGVTPSRCHVLETPYDSPTLISVDDWESGNG